jgi:chromosome segregation ATPase
MSQPSGDDIQNELRDLAQRIDELHRSIDDIVASLSDSGAVDSEERAAALTNREELEGVLSGLEQRRDDLQRRLDG